MSLPADPTWRPPQRLDAAWFFVKRCLLRARRGLRDFVQPAYRVSRWQRGAQWADAPLRFEASAPLWDDGRPEEFVLIAGKVENLRRALRAFDGVELPAGATLSFWRQLGPPWRWRGFVEGREVRSGCVIPTIGGGLCQVSNLLLQAAEALGWDLLERHAHSARVEQVPGAAADATVAWNDVDLRLRASAPLRLELSLDAERLWLRVRSPSPMGQQRKPAIALRPARALVQAPVARGCLTCDEQACFRHRGLPAQQGRGAPLAIVDSWQPEFAAWMAQSPSVPRGIEPWRARAAQRGRWPWRQPERQLWLAGLLSVLAARAGHQEGGGRQALLQARAGRIARAAARCLIPTDVDLLISQELLLPLWREGVLAGRRFEVFVHQLPAVEIQRRLDLASAHHPAHVSLRDFRIDAHEAALEMQALRAAQRCLSAHQAVVDFLGEQGVAVTRLDWCVAPAAGAWVRPAAGSQPCVVLPCSALARKGVVELAALLQQRGALLRVLGSVGSDADCLRGLPGLRVERMGYDEAWWVGAHAVLLPAWVEHAPRAALRALALGMPVIASSACGLPPQPGLCLVEAGDVVAMSNALAPLID